MYDEQKLLNHFDSDAIDTVNIPWFGFRDTIFDYALDVEKYQSTLPKGFEDWHFEIRKNGNDYTLTRIHLNDPTFKEYYEYDDQMNFKKIDIYQGSDTIFFGQ